MNIPQPSRHPQGLTPRATPPAFFYLKKARVNRNYESRIKYIILKINLLWLIFLTTLNNYDIILLPKNGVPSGTVKTKEPGGLR
jgi:hypothetical protein